MTGIETVTFGCRLNGVESDRMARLAVAAGHADLAIVNSCAVTGEAVRQARQAIRRLKRADPARPIVVTGCAAAVDPVAFAAMPEVGRVLDNATKTSPTAWGLLPTAVVPGGGGTARRTRAFLAVQTGCDHRCTFCIIPFGRGAARSVPPATVIAEATALVATGAVEIVLTGVDITAYGRDLTGRPGLGLLCRDLLAAVPTLARLRVSSIDCIEADDALLAAMTDEPRLMPYWHLSLQSGSDLILKRMRRRHGRADAIGFCNALRRARPDVVFGADLIAGFPTETDAMFADTLALIEECGLTHLHVFPFSARPGTPAARMPAVDGGIVRERAARLREAGARALGRHLGRQTGRRLPVLAERGGRGRTPDFTPVHLGSTLEPGRLADLVIKGHDGTALQARPAGSPMPPDGPMPPGGEPSWHGPSPDLTETLFHG